MSWPQSASTMNNGAYIPPASTAGIFVGDGNAFTGATRESYRLPRRDHSVRVQTTLLTAPGNWVWLTTGFNLLLHVAATVCTCIVCFSLHSKNDGDITSKDPDFVATYALIAPIASIVGVLITLLWYNCGENYQTQGRNALVAILCQVCFVWAFLSIVLVQVWVMQSTKTDNRETANDRLTIAAVLLNGLVLSSTLQTPIQGSIVMARDAMAAHTPVSVAPEDAKA